MRQRPFRTLASTLLAATLCAAASCDRPGTTTRPTSSPSSDKRSSDRSVAVHPTIASLVPSATDVLLASGMGKHLVAVSTYCRANPAAAGYPSVGDYQATDWERLTALRPDVMLVFRSEARIEQGMRERAAALGTRLVVVKVETVADVLASITQMGELTNESNAARATRATLQARLNAIKARASIRPNHPRVLLVVGADANAVIGPGGFLDELLLLTGARNAAEPLKVPYPSIDQEKLKSLAPDRIVLLLPGAAPERAESARAALAMRTHVDVRVLTPWHLLQPGMEIGDTAELFEHAIAEDK